jgi:hypothetical protein
MAGQPLPVKVAGGAVTVEPPPLPFLEAFTPETNREDAPLPHYVEGGLVQSGMLTMISGPAKARKSWLLMDLAVAIAGGGAWCGNAVPTTGTVLFLDLEIVPQILQDRFRRICDESGEAGKRAMSRVHILPWRSVATAEGATADRILDEVEKRADALGVDVVILDSVYLLLDGDESDPEAVGRLMRRLARMRNKRAVVFSHHYAKGNTTQQNQKAAIDRASGSSYWSRFADVLIPLTPPEVAESEKERVLLTLEPVVRHYKSPDPKVLEWKDGEHRFHPLSEGQTLQLTVKPKEQKTPTRAPDPERDERVLSVLFDMAVAQNWEPVAVSDWLRECHDKGVCPKGGAFERSLDTLEADDRIIVSLQGKRRYVTIPDSFVVEEEGEEGREERLL